MNGEPAELMALVAYSNVALVANNLRQQYDRVSERLYREELRSFAVMLDSWRPDASAPA